MLNDHRLRAMLNPSGYRWIDSGALGALAHLVVASDVVGSVEFRQRAAFARGRSLCGRDVEGETGTSASVDRSCPSCLSILRA